jgi:hypothetical protein
MIIDRLRDEGDWSAFDLLRRYLPAFLTLRVISEKDRSYSEFERYSSAFLFNISYNIDAALVPQRHLEELLRTARIARIRRSGFAEFDPPRRHYVPDLLYHY